VAQVSRSTSCWAGPEPPAFQLFGTETRRVPALTCQAHAGDTAAVLFGAGASLVLVRPLDNRQAARSARQRRWPEISDVVERVRQIGAFSADPEALRDMETELHTAVLAAVADGAPDAAELAAAALMTVRYGHDRRAR
jgi:hypothetical protein